MYRAQCVLAVVALYVVMAYSWDFAVGSGDLLTFHASDGNEIDRVRIKSQNFGGLAYDVVHNRMLYIDKQDNDDAVCGYYLSSKQNECYIGRNGRNIHSIAYDPVTEKLFFTDAKEKSINWISLKRGYENDLYGNLLIKVDAVDSIPEDIAVDSCGGYIYWTISRSWNPQKDVERARISGSGREFLKFGKNNDYFNVCSLTIDPNAQKIYYFDCNGVQHLMDIANMNGSFVESKFLKIWDEAKELTVSKDYVYFMSLTRDETYKRVWRLSKEKKGHVDPEEISKFYTTGFLGLATNYKIEDQIEGIQNCDSMSNLIPAITEVPTNTLQVDTTCERHDVCVNYCFKGNCSFNDEGLPNCSCNVGYSGDRCEVFSCHGYCLNDGECSLIEFGVPVCQCKGGYFGDRCHVDVCLNYCIQGNCSLSDEGHPICSCDAGYNGDRCEVSLCREHCLNGGECSLNEEDEPMCKCTGNYEGARCEAQVTVTNPTQDFEMTKRNQTLADLLSIWGPRASRTFVTFEIQP